MYVCMYVCVCIYIVYKAAGLGAFQLYDEVDFDGWYQGQLLAELQIQEPRLRCCYHGNT